MAKDERRRLRPTEAKGCPFCGSRPYMQPWHGGLLTKQLIDCQSVRCAVNPAVTGETPEEALRHWNKRAASMTDDTRALIEEAKRTHTKSDAVKGWDWCRACLANWPCPTVRFAEALEAANEHIAMIQRSYGLAPLASRAEPDTEEGQ